jgi:murein DD-endopeptidase MepM/ murein hydrolase activator NlpD
VFAQTETSIDNIVPTIESSQPTAITNPVKKETVAPQATQTQPNFSGRRVKLRQRLRQPEVSQSKPKVEIIAPATNTRLSKPQVEASPVAPVKITEQKPATPLRPIPEKLPEVAQPSNSNSTVGATTGKTKDYNNAYIDPTNYNTGATTTYQAPNSVIITERSSGCRTIVPAGQGLLGGVCAKVPAPTQRVVDANGKPAPSWLRRSQNAQLANVPTARQVVAATNNSSWRATRTDTVGVTKTAYRPNRFIPNPGEFNTTRASSSPIAPSGGTLPPPMAAGNVAPRPSTVAYDFPLASVLPQIPYTGAVAYNGSGMMFPLSVPAPITSLFGWRVHPISGDRRFHAGTDLGAPMGTPILAAARGQVETANWLGGYGLTVIINHSSAQQTLYGHMSEVFVQPGQVVEPGTVIGRVGSTGNSTGPHLHFEVRHLTQDGWVAVDSSVQLQGALSQLVQSTQTARVIQLPDR